MLFLPHECSGCVSDLSRVKHGGLAEVVLCGHFPVVIVQLLEVALFAGFLRVLEFFSSFSRP